MNYTVSGGVISFASLTAGDNFGELAAIDRKPRSATVVAATQCELAVLKGDEFRKLLENESGIAFFMLNRLSTIIRTGDDRIFNFSQLGAAQRVCLELLRLAQSDPVREDGWSVRPLPTQSSIGGTVGTTRRTVSRVMRQLVSEGIVERKSNILHIHDKRYLENVTLQVIQSD